VSIILYNVPMTCVNHPLQCTYSMCQPSFTMYLYHVSTTLYNVPITFVNHPSEIFFFLAVWKNIASLLKAKCSVPELLYYSVSLLCVKSNVESTACFVISCWSEESHCKHWQFMSMFSFKTLWIIKGWLTHVIGTL
jgi:hypothetical protein